MQSMYDWTLYHVPEGINPEEHVIATYLIEKEPDVDVLNYAVSIAIEQSTGTWVPVPEETPALRQKHAGKVVGIRCGRSTPARSSAYMRYPTTSLSCRRELRGGLL